MWRKDRNEAVRQRWLSEVLAQVPAGARLLDAGAGELKNRCHCRHLDYVSQDFCEYHGSSESSDAGLHPTTWDVSGIDIVSDITSIPEPDGSFDAILCSEVLEHVPEPTHVLDEFARLLRPGGLLIVTAPFSSIVHFAPYHFCTGFTRYWYQHHLSHRKFRIDSLVANGDWQSLICQELRRVGYRQRTQGSWIWPVSYLYALCGELLLGGQRDPAGKDLACFGFHCIATKMVS